MNTLKKGGVILAPPQQTDAVYDIVFGAEAPQSPYNWKPYLPVVENQKNIPFCVSFSRLNCAETLAKRDGLELNLSDRHLGVISGTSKSGNSLNAVSEAFRTLGIVREEYFEWKPGMMEDTSTFWTEIFDTSSIPSDARRYFGGNHSWVNDREAMKSALAFSPLQIAFPVGETYFNSVVKPPQNIGGYHAVLLYWIDTQGNYYIFDSVDGAEKILDSNYPISQCKSFRDLPENWKTIEPPIDGNILAWFYSHTWLGNIIFRLAELLGLNNREKDIIKRLQEETPPPPPTPPKYIWSTPKDACHSVRVICDEEGMSVIDKNLICQTINCESGFNIKAIHVNKSGSGDYGICQINDHYWIGEDKAFPSIEYVLENPEACVRWMIKQWKAGHRNWWVCYKDNLYKNYSAKV